MKALQARPDPPTRFVPLNAADYPVKLAATILAGRPRCRADGWAGSVPAGEELGGAGQPEGGEAGHHPVPIHGVEGVLDQ